MVVSGGRSIHYLVPAVTENFFLEEDIRGLHNTAAQTWIGPVEILRVCERTAKIGEELAFASCWMWADTLRFARGRPLLIKLAAIQTIATRVSFVLRREAKKQVSGTVR